MPAIFEGKGLGSLHGASCGSDKNRVMLFPDEGLPGYTVNGAEKVSSFGSFYLFFIALVIISCFSFSLFYIFVISLLSLLSGFLRSLLFPCAFSCFPGCAWMKRNKRGDIRHDSPANFNWGLQNQN